MLKWAYVVVFFVDVIWMIRQRPWWDVRSLLSDYTRKQGQTAASLPAAYTERVYRWVRLRCLPVHV